MSLYFFDISDGVMAPAIDDVGSNLPGPEQVREEVLLALSQIMRDRLPDSDSRQFEAAVRDGNGRVIYRATLTFKGEWSG